MHLALVGAFEARWTEAIHEEWMRNLLANRPDLTIAQLNRTRMLMNANAEGSVVEGYEYYIPKLTLPDPDDRHVLAAAIIAEADTIVTTNLHDFPAAILISYEVTAQHPDSFLCELYASNSAKVLEAVRNQRGALRSPPLTVAELFATFTDNGLINFVGLLKPHADGL